MKAQDQRRRGVDLFFWRGGYVGFVGFSAIGAGCTQEGFKCKDVGSWVSAEFGSTPGGVSVWGCAEDVVVGRGQWPSLSWLAPRASL